MRRLIAASLFLLFSVTAGAANAQQSGLQKLNLGISFVASSTVHLWIAEDEGLFKKHGLEVKAILFRGSAAATQALLGGSVDIVFGTASAAITVAARGAPVAVIAGTRLIDYILATRPDTTEPEQLRGKSVGISNFSGGDDFALIRLLPKLGLQPKTEVKFFVLGTPNPYQKAEAVLNGTTAGTLVTFEVLETLKLNGKEMHRMASLLENGIKLSTGDVFTTRPFIKEHPDQVKSFLKAYSEAIRLAKNNKALVFAALRKHTNTKDDVILGKIYQDTIIDGFVDPPYPLIEAIETVREDLEQNEPDMTKLKQMKVADFIDTGPMDELAKEGFFKSLPAVKAN